MKKGLHVFLSTCRWGDLMARSVRTTLVYTCSLSVTINHAPFPSQKLEKDEELYVRPPPPSLGALLYSTLFSCKRKGPTQAGLSQKELLYKYGGISEN